MTNTELLDLAIAAYCDQFNATAELPADDRITPRDIIDSSIHRLDTNSALISILDDDCSISILALRITITNDRFATNDETFKFFLSIDSCAYIPLP